MSAADAIPHFNAAVIGNSTGQMIDPFRLSRETDLRFIQLSIPATGPREQLAIMRWVISHHPRRTVPSSS